MLKNIAKHISDARDRLGICHYRLLMCLQCLKPTQEVKALVERYCK